MAISLGRTPLRTLAQTACRRRFDSDLDLLMVLTEAVVPISLTSLLESVPGAPPMRLHGCTDCRPRFAQIFFCKSYFYLDVPRTVLSPTQSEAIVQSRTGFEQHTGVFAPLQKGYSYRQPIELAEDLKFIFDVLGIPTHNLLVEYSELPLSVPEASQISTKKCYK